LRVKWNDQVLQGGLLTDFTAIVEQVRDGTQFRVRLLIDEHRHQFVNLVGALDMILMLRLILMLYKMLAGAKSPRASNSREGEAGTAEPWGEEVCPLLLDSV
jgi:staphylococcal nuclease domain-containing protein 1